MHPACLEASLGRSLESLGLETVDLLYIHNAAESQLRAVGRPAFMQVGCWRFFGRVTWFPNQKHGCPIAGRGRTGRLLCRWGLGGMLMSGMPWTVSTCHGCNVLSSLHPQGPRAVACPAWHVLGFQRKWRMDEV